MQPPITFLVPTNLRSLCLLHLPFRIAAVPNIHAPLPSVFLRLNKVQYLVLLARIAVCVFSQWMGNGCNARNASGNFTAVAFRAATALPEVRSGLCVRTAEDWGKEIGFRRPAGIFHSDPRVENLARRSYHSHNSISRASLAQLLMGVSKCVRPAKNTKKHELVRRLVFIEFGVNVSIAPAAGGRLTAFHDIPADGTVARWLWDELQGMAMGFPAAGLGGLDGLQPHVQRHMSSML